MTVHCPQCLTGYVIPENLLGPGGARVRCPECSEEFVVVRDGVTTPGERGPDEAGTEHVIAEATSDAASGGSGVTAGAAAPRAARAGDATTRTPRAKAARARAVTAEAAMIEAAAPATPPPAVAEAPEPATRSPRLEEPEQVAGAVLGVLTDFLGESLARSRGRGTVLSDHGPAIMAVFDEYRRRAGADAPSQVFRAALRDHVGVDLSQVNGG